MRRALAVALALALALGVAACAARQSPPTEIAAVQRTEQDLGYEPTENFEQHQAKPGYRICYWTGPFELPVDYAGLQYREGKCPAKAAGQDVFLYEPEALAGRRAPVTAALAEAPEPRQAFVTAHEDFHDQPGVRQLEPARKEAYSTLAGLLTAAETAGREHGEDSEQARAARRELELFRTKSRLVNQAHAELGRLYERVRGGDLSPADGLRRKAAAFADLARECAAADPAPAAFALCPAVLNNAGLAFDATYTRRFEEAWALYEAAGRDAAATIAALRSAAEGCPAC
ncbi:MAG: hypothetical protein GC160_23790 [Acidobacteria bacterium]|nr:hypothetical protein [Acidobacteriota bacterium]